MSTVTYGRIDFVHLGKCRNAKYKLMLKNRFDYQLWEYRSLAEHQWITIRQNLKNVDWILVRNWKIIEQHGDCFRLVVNHHVAMKEALGNTHV